jgi:hypothetical protein
MSEEKGVVEMARRCRHGGREIGSVALFWKGGGKGTEALGKEKSCGLRKWARRSARPELDRCPERSSHLK